MKGEWIDREEAWLRFDKRVLAQAEDVNVPLLEKLQFCSIYGSNCDEYYGTRVARMFGNHKIVLYGKNKEDEDKIRELNKIAAMTAEGNSRRDRDVRRIFRSLADNGILLAEYSRRSAKERTRQAELFDKTVKPYCSVFAWQDAVYPTLVSNAVYAAVMVQKRTERSGSDLFDGTKLFLVSCDAKATVLTETVSQDGTVPQAETVSQDGTVPQAETAPQDGTVPQAETAPQDGIVPQAETVSQDGTVPQAETAPQDGTVPQAETAPQDGTVSEIKRLYTAEDLLLHHVRRLFPKKRVLAAMLFKLTKNSELTDIMEISARDNGYPEKIRRMVAGRVYGDSIKLEYIAGQTAKKYGFPEKLREILEVSPQTCFECRSFLSFDWLSELRRAVKDDCPALSYPPAEPIPVDDNSLLPESLMKKSVCLHYPYHSVEHYLSFLRHAVEDKRTLRIQMTVYRLASDSRIAALLKEAAGRGIDVHVVIELRARFDEEANGKVADELKQAGCHVIYGYETLKVHAKLTLVTYSAKLSDEKDVITYYAHIGTGNYNEKTAKLYTDLNLFTADKTICHDVAELFDCMINGKISKKETSLLIAPVNLRDRLNMQIEAETKKGKSGYILMKMNSLTDRTMAMKLVKAADAGVKLNLIVRGVCCLNPAMSKHPENIHVISIVGRFLEHLRVYSFGRSADDRRMFIGSADIMNRNIEKRVEVLVPIFDASIRNQLYRMLCCQLNDTAKAYVLQQNGEYRRVCPFCEKKESNSLLFDSQMELFRFYADR